MERHLYPVPPCGFGGQLRQKIIKCGLNVSNTFHTVIRLRLVAVIASRFCPFGAGVSIAKSFIKNFLAFLIRSNLKDIFCELNVLQKSADFFLCLSQWRGASHRADISRREGLTGLLAVVDTDVGALLGVGDVTVLGVKNYIK